MGTMKYEIWIEGFLIQGMEGVPARAEKLAEIEAPSFKEACDRYFRMPLVNDENYDPEKLTDWGCRLFDNEADARRSFG